MSMNILLLGDSSVGKTSIINQYVEGKFEENFISTCGLDLKEKKIIINDKQYQLLIMDTSGQERYHSIAESYYKRADGIILVFDITNRNSFNSLKNSWLKDVNSHGYFPKIVVGNKKDLENIRVIKNEDIEKNKEFNEIEYFETSAKTKENIETIFNKIAELILLNPNRKRVKSFKLKLSDNKQGKKTKNNCCNN